MWPQRWIGTLYSQLYIKYHIDTFNFSDFLQVTSSEGMAKAALTGMRRHNLLYTFDIVNRRRLYRLASPEALPLLSSGQLMNLHLVRQGRYSRLLGILVAELLRRVKGVDSIVLYGSVAMGMARKDSDVDLLVLLDGEAFGKRLNRLIDVEGCERVEEELEWLYLHDVDTHISFLPLSPDEVKRLPPIMLDILEEGFILFDKGVYGPLAEGLKDRLKAMGAKRIFIAKDEWYWDLKPDIKFGEVFTL